MALTTVSSDCLTVLVDSVLPTSSPKSPVASCTVADEVVAADLEAMGKGAAAGGVVEEEEEADDDPDRERPESIELETVMMLVD
jgi:hypothetical protein